MSKKVAVYIRVSTKEQADNGTSLADQEKVARRFCKDNGWEFIALYDDDCSGKKFDNRPGFRRFEADLKAKRIQPDILLVARMDRFSRDAHNTLNKWKELKKYGVELMTCDSNYDLSVPENLLPFMLQVILPQVENERRGLNTKNGMRAKIREGRYMGKAPRGYKNVTTEEGKMIIPDENASDVQYAFNEIAKGIISRNDVLKQMRKGGFKMSTAQFYKMLENVIYIGKVVTKEDNNEPPEVIVGIHEAIIPEHIFNKVQVILNGKKKPSLSKTKHKEYIPLTRLLICSSCGKPFTGSRSKGGSDIKYYYYHCQTKCKRYRADMMHRELIQLLKSFEMPQAFLTLYKEVLMDIISCNQKTQKQKVKEIDGKIQQYRDKLTEAEDKLLDDVLSDSAYKRIDERYGKVIDELLTQRVDISLSASPIEEYVESGLTLMADLPGYYTNADADTKRMIVSSIFPDKLEFNGKNYRTFKLNAFISQIANYIKVYGEGEKEKALISENLSSEVAPTRIELVSKV